MTGNAADTTPKISPQELRSRVIYSMLLPAVRLAQRFRVPLKEIGHWLELAYFREIRQSGLTLKETGDALGVGMRKSAELSRKLKDNFFGPELEHELPRRVEYILWAEPASRARLHQLLRNTDPADIDAAIERLITEQRVRLADGRTDVFTVTSMAARLVRPSWMAKIDGINNLARTVANATHARVFRESPHALLRTLSFRMAPDDVDELRALYEDVIFPRLAALELRAKGRDDALNMDFSVLWCAEDEAAHLSGGD